MMTLTKTMTVVVAVRRLRWFEGFERDGTGAGEAEEREFRVARKEGRVKDCGVRARDGASEKTERERGVGKSCV